MGLLVGVLVSPLSSGAQARPVSPRSIQPLSTPTLTQAPGSDGCLSNATSAPDASCSTTLRGLKEVQGIAVSPDGANVYVAATPAEGGLLVFDRDTRTGLLTQKSGSAGCIVEATNVSRDQSCGTGRLIGSGWGGGTNIVVSPDGKNVYLASAQYRSISVFDRDLQTGALTQKTGSAGCIHNTDASIPAGTSGCDSTGRAMAALLTLAVSPDGTNVYGSTWSESVVVFDRDTASGVLTQKTGAAGCYVSSALADCTVVSAPVRLTQTQNLLVSNDGNHVYVTSYTGGRIWIFGRDTSNTSARGTLGVVDCVKAVGVAGGCATEFRGLDWANRIFQSPDGSTLYVVGDTGRGIAILRRDPATGLLTQGALAAGCIADPSVVSTAMWSGCETARGLGTTTTSSTLRLAVGPEKVYVASSAFDAVLVLDRSPTDGSLTQSVGTDGCFASSPTVSACTSATGLYRPTAIALESTSASLYVGSSRSSAPLYSALTVFSSGDSSSSGPSPSPSPSNDSTPTSAITPVFRATIDPNGGICLDANSKRDTPWTSVFVGYRYLPSTVDCTRDGYVFAGWASTDDPTTLVDLPHLTDPSDGERRMFLAANADLVALWTPVPDELTDLTVFANFLCGPCTSAWLLFTLPTDANVYTVSVNDSPIDCTQSGSLFDLSLCELTDLTPGPVTFAVTPQHGETNGPVTTASLTLSS